MVMTMIIPLADAKARLSAVLDDVRDTHDRVVITRNGRAAEAEIARGEAIGADELRRLIAERARNERDAG
jgi:antitoxin YefM